MTSARRATITRFRRLACFGRATTPQAAPVFQAAECGLKTQACPPWRGCGGGSGGPGGRPWTPPAADLAAPRRRRSDSCLHKCRQHVDESGRSAKSQCDNAWTLARSSQASEALQGVRANAPAPAGPRPAQGRAQRPRQRTMETRGSPWSLVFAVFFTQYL